jgi:hypothetical protein
LIVLKTWLFSDENFEGEFLRHIGGEAGDNIIETFFGTGIPEIS